MNKKKTHPDPVTEWVDVSPKIAQEWLTKNVIINRPLSLKTVAAYAALMEAGTWYASAPHTPIAFDWDEALINGQHRLHAVVMSGKTISFLVMLGCDPESFRYIDQGVTRGASDHFVVMFKKANAGRAPENHRWVTSTVRAMFEGFRHLGHSSVRPTKLQIAEASMRHHDLVQELLGVLHKRTCHVFSASLCAAFANACLYFGKEGIVPLAERLGEGLWTGPKDPMKALSDGLVKAMVPKEERNAYSKTLDRGAYYAYAVAAIRAALLGKHISRVEPTEKDWGEGDADNRIRKALGAQSSGKVLTGSHLDPNTKKTSTAAPMSESSVDLDEVEA